MTLTIVVIVEDKSWKKQKLLNLFLLSAYLSERIANPVVLPEFALLKSIFLKY